MLITGLLLQSRYQHDKKHAEYTIMMYSFGSYNRYLSNCCPQTLIVVYLAVCEKKFYYAIWIPSIDHFCMCMQGHLGYILLFSYTSIMLPKFIYVNHTCTFSTARWFLCSWPLALSRKWNTFFTQMRSSFKKKKKKRCSTYYSYSLQQLNLS